MTLQDLDLDTLTSADAAELLRNGERMDRRTFHELYERTPPDFKAELIGGTVCVSSPMKVPHGRHQFLTVTWLGLYQVATPGTDGRDNTTAILDEDSEPQPDVTLVVDPACGGQSTVNADQYAEGPPELVVEVSDSTARHDLGAKFRDYERSGVREYLVVDVSAAAVCWFALENGRFVELGPDADGLLRSTVFPGLWMDPAALLALDSAAVVAALNRGLADPSHAEFVARLRR